MSLLLRKSRSIVAFFRLLFAASLFLVCFAAASDAQQYTQNKADQVLRSNGRVNPSTLGLR